MSDLLALPPDEFAALVRQAFEACRAGDFHALLSLPLTRSPLVTDCFLSDEPITDNTRRRALQAALQWAIDQFKPEGAHSWKDVEWRAWNILFYHYWQGERIAELADRMALGEQRLYELRARYFDALVLRLREELKNPQDTAGRKQAYIAARYAAFSPLEQAALRLTAIFRRAIPIPLLEQLLNKAVSQPVRRTDLDALIAARWLRVNAEHTTVEIHPEIRAVMLAKVASDERRRWHTWAGDYYQEQADYLEAAFHLRQAERYEEAAATLIAHQRKIINQNMPGLRSLLAEFRPTEIPESAWMRFRLIAGELAEKMQAVDAAIEEYGQALGAKDVAIQAEAYYRRAKVLRLKNVDEALAHYKRCIQLLEKSQTNTNLLAQAYIGEAWIFADQRPNFSKAQADLQRARELIDPADRELWAHLHNTWGELACHQGDLPGAIEHHLENWLAANETQNTELMLRALYNLGRAYTDAQQPQQALEYLQKCLDVARQAGDRRMQGVSQDAMGACHFLLGDYRTAIEHYLAAHEIFAGMGNRDWLAGNCYNLAEAHIAQGELEAARQRLTEGITIAQELGLQRYVEAFVALVAQHPQLDPRLTALQAHIVACVRAHGSITRGKCEELFGVSNRAAREALSDLVEKHILARVGSGRSTHYILERIK